MNMSYKICFVCTGNACRSPFAECVMKKRLSDAGMDNIEVFSVGTLDWGENPRDVVITDVAKEMGYELTGITTRMTHDRLMEADVIIVFDQQHHDAITSVLDYSNWNRIILFNKIALNMEGNVEDPYYQSVAVYRRVAQHIENGCKQLIEKWKQHPPKSEN